MITSLIIGALIAMLAGGSYFMIPDIKKRVKGMVGDPIRLAALNKAILAAEQASKARDKKDYQATATQLQELLDRLNTCRLNVYTAFSDLYLRLSEACTDEEWKMAAKALKTTSKATG